MFSFWIRLSFNYKIKTIKAAFISFCTDTFELKSQPPQIKIKMWKNEAWKGTTRPSNPTGKPGASDPSQRAPVELEGSKQHGGGGGPERWRINEWLSASCSGWQHHDSAVSWMDGGVMMEEAGSDTECVCNQVKQEEKKKKKWDGPNSYTTIQSWETLCRSTEWAGFV